MNLIIPVNNSDHIKGKENSHVTLVEYGDFECSYCRQTYPIVKEILKIKGKEIKFVFRNFPLSEIHRHALHAAYAAESASKQGKFWDMYDKIFENQQILEDQILIASAKNLNLDIEQFKKDMGSEEIVKTVKAHFMGGVKSGVNGTPTFFINNVRYDGPHEFEPLIRALESANKN